MALLGKERSKKLNSNYQGVLDRLNTIRYRKSFIETFDNYILKLNARIKMNKKLIEDNQDAIIINGLNMKTALVNIRKEIK